MMSTMPVIFLMGPTASGKSHLAMQWAQKYPIEIISVDSAMVYRGMDIGTAKPSLAERQRVPHHLIDVCDPADRYSVAMFCQAAQEAIEQILARDRIPLLVGGTMLYHRALLYGLSTLPPANSEIREEINQQARQLGWPALHQKLKQIDPISYQKILPQDAQRIQRALEIYQLTGQPISSYWQQDKPIVNWPFKLLAIVPEARHILHQRIAARFNQMLSLGLVNEVERLYQRSDLHVDLPAIRCVGYRQIWQMLAGQCSYEQMVDKAVAATRQLAKRQLTWLRHWPDKIICLAPDTAEECDLQDFYI